MVCLSPFQIHNVTIGLCCGYDLLAGAVQALLSEAGFQVRIITPDQIDGLLHPAPALLLLDDAALEQANLSTLQQALPQTQLLILDSRCTPQRVLYATRQGVHGYLYLGDALSGRLVQAVTDVLQGGNYFSPYAAAALADAHMLAAHILPRVTPYHRAVLHHMADHRPAGQIAAELERSIEAIYQVQRYLRNLLDVDTNGALVKRARAWGIIPPLP